MYYIVLRLSILMLVPISSSLQNALEKLSRDDSSAPDGRGVATAHDTRDDALLRHGLLSHTAGAVPVQLPNAAGADQASIREI